MCRSILACIWSTNTASAGALYLRETFFFHLYDVFKNFMYVRKHERM